MAKIELAITNRIFKELSFEDLLLNLHHRTCASLNMKIVVGAWRRKDVCVGNNHTPPSFWDVPVLMRNYTADLEERLKPRLANSNVDLDDQLIDHLTFAEGRFLHIHPFEDLNGRVSRLFLIELLYRLDLPPIDPAAMSSDDTEKQNYFAALQAYDRGKYGPFSNIWRQRFTLDTPQLYHRTTIFLYQPH